MRVLSIIFLNLAHFHILTDALRFYYSLYQQQNIYFFDSLQYDIVTGHPKIYLFTIVDVTLMI